MGAASVVLLKNERNALPLGKKDRTVVLIGSDAGPGSAGPNEFADRVRLIFESIIATNRCFLLFREAQMVFLLWDGVQEQSISLIL